MRRYIAVIVVLAFLAGSAPGLLAQQPGGGSPPAEKPPGEAAAKQSHEEEFWYRVWYRKEPIGHAHYTLDRISPAGGKPRFRIMMEWQITPVKGLPFSHSGRSSTIVNDKYELVESEWGNHWRRDTEELELRFKAKILDGNLWVDGPKGSVMLEKWSETDFGVEVMLGKFLAAKGLSPGKTHLFKMITGLPNPLLNELSIQVKEKSQLKADQGTFEGFTCVMTMPATYTSVQAEPMNWNLFVDPEGRILRYQTGELEFIVADDTVRDNPPLPFAARGRRDPFRNPMIVKPKDATAQATTQAAGGSTAAQTVTLTKEEQSQFYQQAADYLARMERDNGDATVPRETRLGWLRDTYEKLGTLVGMVREKEKKDVKFLDKIDKIVKRAQELYSGVERIASDMQRLRDEAQADFDEGRFAPLNEKLQLATQHVSNTAIKDTKYEKEILQNFSTVRDLRDRGRKRESFAARKPQIVGIIYHLVPEPISLHLGLELFGRRIEGEHQADILRSRSSALIKVGGGTEPTILEEGATIDNDTVVFKIERGAVHFNYQGEQIRVDLGRE